MTLEEKLNEFKAEGIAEGNNNKNKKAETGVNPKSWTTNWRGFSYETDI